MTNREFYHQEHLTYRGPWNVQIPADIACALVGQLLRRMGEAPVCVLVLHGRDYHQAFEDRIEFIAGEITCQAVIHEVAHVIQSREQGWYGPEHDEDLWSLIALVGQVLEEIT